MITGYNSSMHKKVAEHFSIDPTMLNLIEKYGELDWNYNSVPFDDLVSSIISQQLSTKAADTIYKRFLGLVGGEPLDFETILKTDDETLRGAGISYSKIKYIKAISYATKIGELDFEAMNNMSDEEVIFELTKIKGIGRWTAEMFLIFTLKRPDVFSIGDAGLRRAMVNLYRVDEKDLQKMEIITSKWSPYRSYASRYLWKSLDNK